MKIVITNVYCYLNKGDAGIVVAMVEQLRRKFDNPEIYIVSLHPETDNEKYGSNVILMDPVIPLSSSKNPYLRVIHNIVNFLRAKININLNVKNKTLQTMAEADLIVSCGGGYMQSFGMKFFLDNFILHFAQLYCARRLRKKYVIFAQTIGPFNRIETKCIRPIINDASMVLARETTSQQYVVKNFPKAKTFLTADVAFLLAPEYCDFPINSSFINVGVTVREWHFPNRSDWKELRERYVNGIVSFMRERGPDSNFVFYLMPQCIVPNGDNDLVIASEILSRLSGQENVHIVTQDLTPGQLKYLYGKMSFFIGMRMHSNIFALGSRTPCLAISYDRKTNGIMKLVGMSDYVIDIDKLDVHALDVSFEHLLNDKTVRNRLDVVIPKIESEARKNFDYLNDIVDEER